MAQHLRTTSLRITSLVSSGAEASMLFHVSSRVRRSTMMSSNASFGVLGTVSQGISFHSRIPVMI